MTRRTALCALTTATTLAAGLIGLCTSPASAAAPATGTHVRIGMATPASAWGSSLQSAGSVDSRRIYDDLTSPDSAVTTARSELAAGRLPVLSFKVPGNDWSGVAAGRYDAALIGLRDRLAALPGRVFVTLHHEPTGDGTPADYAAMQRHALPILGAPANVDAGVIVNGFWWSHDNQGLSDAEIAQWLPADVLRLSEVVAADAYQGGVPGSPGEDAGVKIRGLSAWASRVGVTRLGVGEYNGLDGAGMRAAGDAVLADPRFVFALCFNSDVNNRAGVSWALSGDRLAAFQETVARARAATGSGDQPTAGQPAPIQPPPIQPPPIQAPPADPQPPVAPRPPGTIRGGRDLTAGSTLRSPNGRYVFTQQGDGNAVVYDGPRPLWNSRTFVPGSTFVQQTDGNGVVYAPGGRPVWSSGTSGLAGAYMIMQDDGNLVVYTADGRPRWNSFAAR